MTTLNLWNTELERWEPVRGLQGEGVVARLQNTTYKNGDILASVELPLWACLECMTAGATGTANLNPIVAAIGQKITDGTCVWVIRHKGEMQNVGDIWMTKAAFNADGYPIHKLTGLAMLDCHICDGTNGTINMIDKFAMGANKTGIGGAGGANSRVLSIAQIPAHAHGASAWTDAQGYHGHNQSAGTHKFLGVANYATSMTSIGSGGYWIDWWSECSITPDGSHGHNIGISVANAGSGQAFDNRPAYVAVAFIQKIY